MADTKTKSQTPIILRYGKDDLIMKEGDYGISIYKIREGNVRVTSGSGDSRAVLANLGPGDLFGEMAFMNKDAEIRSASVRAIDSVELEVLHPSTLKAEFSKMSPILKYVVTQTLKRLLRMNRILSQLSLKEKEVAKKPKKSLVEQRQYYRKKIESPCVYRPVGSGAKVKLRGKTIDISVGGIALDISSKNTFNFDHKPGTQLRIQTTLPNGRPLEFVGKVKSVEKDHSPGRLKVGVQFTRLSGNDTKNLGFFMMS
jgi:CRP-like cAMP-binding protein